MKTSYRPPYQRNDDSFTLGQKVLLGVMIFLVIVVFGVLAYLVLGNGKGQSPSSDAPTTIPYVTLTSSPVPTLAPLQTPTPIPGWIRFNGGGVGLSLPGSFQGGDAEVDRTQIFNQLETAGADPTYFGELEQFFIDQHVVIYAFEDSETEIFFTELFVYNRETGSGTLNSVVDDFIGEIQGTLPFRMVGREEVFLSTYKMERALMERKDTVEEGTYYTYGTRVLYFLKDDSLIWIIQYTTDRDQVKAKFPTFDLSVSTFSKDS